MLPSLSRVRVEVARDRVVVVEDVALPRGDWTGGGLDLHVAFGAPGTPIAVDAGLLAAPLGTSEPRSDEQAEPVRVEIDGARPPGARALTGKARMAGAVLRVKDAQLRHAYDATDVAVVRVRSLLTLPAVDAGGRREVVVRLGAPDGVPLTLGHIQVASVEPGASITRAEATLCGPDADRWPLAVALTPKPARPPAALAERPIAPSMAVRHASDDLCIAWWTSD
jgi:hypothetical protein